MSIKTQKILQFIPIFNIIIFYFWVKMLLEKSINIRESFIDFLKINVFIFIVTVFEILCSFVFESEMLNIIILLIYIHLFFLSMCWMTIRAEERIKNSNSD